MGAERKPASVIKQGDCGEVAGCGCGYKAVPDGIVEFQAFPDVKDDAGGVQNSAGDDQVDNERRQNLRESPCGGDAYPAQGEIDQNGETVEAARKQKFHCDAESGAEPGDQPQRPALRGIGQKRQERRIGASDQQENGAVIEAAQNPFELRGRCQVIGGGTGQHHNQAEEIGRQHPSDARMEEQHDASREGGENACTMNQGIGADFVPRVGPVTFEEEMHVF